MNLSEPADPRTHPVTFDISAPRQPVLPQATPHAEPDRVSQRLGDIEHRLCLLEGSMATLAGALNGGKA
jgi:hypothetical protein